MPMSSSPAPAAGRGDRPWLVVTAWLLLLMCVAFIFVGHRFATVEPDVAAYDATGPSMDTLFAGRMIVGFDQIGRQIGELESATDTSELFSDMEEAVPADRPIDQLRLAIVEAELRGAEPARQRLERVLAELASRGPPEGVDDEPAVAPSAEDEQTDEADEADEAGVIDHLTATDEAGADVSAEALRRDTESLLAIYRGGSLAQLDRADRDGLVERHRWFGELAMTHAPDAPAGQRAAVVGEAMRVAVAAMSVTVMLLLLGAAGLALFIVALVLWAVGRLPMHYQRATVGRTGPFLETAVVFLLMMIGLSLLVPTVERWTNLRIGFAAQFVAVLAIFWPLVRGVSWAGWRDAVGWRRGAGAWREVGCGVLGYVAGVPIIAAGLLLTMLMTYLLPEDPTHPMTQEIFDGDFWQLLAAFALAVIWAPVVEETIFRGAFYHHVRRRWNAVLAGLAVGLVFAAIHPQGIAGVPVLTSVALVFALVREWRGSLIAPMVGHAIHNLGATLVMILLLR